MSIRVHHCCRVSRVFQLPVCGETQLFTNAKRKIRCNRVDRKTNTVNARAARGYTINQIKHIYKTEYRKKYIKTIAGPYFGNKVAYESAKYILKKKQYVQTIFFTAHDGNFVSEIRTNYY